MRREAAAGKQGGRTQEIQRLIGRSLRAVVDLEALGERQITVDCDVHPGRWRHPHRLDHRRLGGAGRLPAWMKARNMVKLDNGAADNVAAISCGIYNGTPVLDLDYAEDSEAETDANFVMTGAGGIVEIQGTARASAQGSGHAALADDSGLCVEALGGDPGIYSARWAGETKDFAIAMARIENELRAKGLTTSAAKFVCALSLALPSGEIQTFEGEVHGTLTFPPRGDHGFGYDPIFIADGMGQTFAEIDPAQKHAMSHRAKAFEKLLHSGIFVESL
jgi:non-canonical purine NTP pyrophosphatase (RdgB/HAM1 family)